MLTFGSLFSGIGGFDLGLERAGMACKWQCEIDPFCNKVLAKHWPNVKRYGDIKEIGGYNLETVDLICGGFPCQPFSFAGKRRGKKDDRYLWPEMLRVIAEVKPAWVIGENVPGIIHMELDKVLSDLEAEGYETQTLIIPACAVDAPHRRERIWILAYSKTNRDRQFEDSNRHKGNECNCERWKRVGDKSNNCCQDVADASCKRQENYQRGNKTERVKRNRAIISCCGAGREYAKWLPEPGVGRVVNGIPRKVDRLKSLGNAVVPQIVEVIGQFIVKIEDI